MTKNHDQEQVTKGAMKKIKDTWGDADYPVKVKSTDQDMITKRQAKEAVFYATGGESFGEFYESGEFQAIDRLPAEPQGKDCVERKEVLAELQNLYEVLDPSKHDVCSCLTEILHVKSKIAKLPPTLPARQALPASGQARPDKEIERAIEYFKSKHMESAFPELGVNFRDMRLLEWVLGEENEWSNIFKKIKEKTDEKSSGD